MLGRATTTIGVAAAAALLPLALAASPAQSAENATVSVLHGVPGLTVDVYANGDELIPDFEPGTLTDPLKLPAGTYDLAVFPAGEGPGGDPAIEANDVEVPAGANATVVAHLDADGDPMLSLFANDTSSVPAGQARLTVRHVAAAPAVDVRAGEQPVFEGLENPDEDSTQVPAGTVSADVVLAGTSEVAIGPADLDLAEGTNTIVYAWGSAEDDNLALATQTIDGLHSAPKGVPAGAAGLAGDGEGMPMWLLLTTAVGLAGAAGATARLGAGAGAQLTVRHPRPAAVALALCLGVAAGLPSVWLLTRTAADVGSRPSADAPPPSRGSAESSAPAPPLFGRAASPRRNPQAGAAPTRVRIPAIGVDAAVLAVGVARDGAMRIPRDARRVGWYRFGPRPGGGAGSVVLAAHVDSRTQGLGAFYPLRNADAGDRVTVVADGGRRSTYRVVAREFFRKRALPLEDLFRRDGRAVLTLITCGGPYLADAGGYQDNVVVSAVPVRS